MAADIGIGTVITAASSLVGTLAGVATLGWWLKTQFANSEIRGNERLEAVKDLLIEKINAHEQIDIERFDKAADRAARQDLAIMRIEMRQQGREAAIPAQAATPFEV